jgi:putative membrane protein
MLNNPMIELTIKSYIIMNTYKKTALFRDLSLVAVMAFCLSTARADDIVNQGQLTPRDYKFATDAIQGGNMEINLGQIAAQKGADQSVRDFGTRMVQDHQKANQELNELLHQRGATVPADSDKKADKMTEHLQTLSGSEFDQTYIKHMISDHKTVIKAFQKEADKGDDTDLKNWAAKTLPTIQEHLRLAENAQAAISSSKPQPAAP